MISLDGVTLRPLEFDDIDTLYAWDSNTSSSRNGLSTSRIAGEN